MIESTANQLIARLPTAPDLTKATDGISGFFSGFASGSKMQGEMQEQEKLAAEGKRPPVTFADRMGGFAGAYLRAQAEREAAADPLFSLKHKVLEQEAQMNAFQIEQAIKQRDEQIQARALAEQFSGMVSQALRDGRANDPQTIAEILEFSGRNPVIMGSPQWKESMVLWQIGQKTQKEAENIRRGLEAEANARAQGLQETVTLAPDGQILRQDFEPRTPLSSFGKLESDIAEAESRGDTEMAERLRQRLEIDKQRVQISQQNANTQAEQLRIAQEKLRQNQERISGQLPPLERDLFRSELRALENRLDLMSKPERMAEEREKILQKYQRMLGAGKSGVIPDRAFTRDPLQNNKLVPIQ